MGMLDPKRYLTGTSQNPGAVEVGQPFTIHNARVEGKVTIRNREVTEVKLLISTDTEPTPFVVYSTGAAIAQQIARIDANDRTRMSNGDYRVKLATRDTGKGSPAYVIVDPSSPDVLTTNSGEPEEAPDF